MSRFDESGDIVDAKSGKKVQINKDYAKYSPRPIPECLDDLRRSTEAATGCKFNFCLVNYYASGSDSISYHSDDERFLGELPAIASFSLGARRDFLMKHKPIAPNEKAPPALETKPVKLPLASGDMILMRGTTQANVTNLFLCPMSHVPYFTGRENEEYSRLSPGSLPSQETSC
jgi:alkylated DNA repair dioxygenase AlkB